ncbi:MAG: 3-oxoacyl-ACP reductase FabG [Firmicutes bacterium]|nr:3-oxoacyl-ACP reductase FabG [Bacillota bacterium]
MNDTVVITGGSRGIGRAAVKAFAAAGYRVAVIYKNAEKQAEELAEELKAGGTDSEIYRCDVSSYSETGLVCKKILERFGRADILVNNAGISQIKLFTDITEQDWDDMFAVNMKGTFNFCSWLIPHMISRKSGNIINISSMWGVEGASCEVHYSASKAAVIGFTKALAKELGPSGINVNCVAPGFIDTDMNKELGGEAAKMFIDEVPLQRAGSVEDIANVIVFLASKGAKYITGQVINVNGGIV